MSGTRFVDLLRHGQPEGGSRFRGRLDDPLSDLGWAQLRQATVGGGWDAVATSPLGRCRAFAEDYAGRHRLPLAVVDEFAEVGFGAWEGRSKEDIARSDPEALARFRADPVHARPPGAEPLDGFLARVAMGWERLSELSGERLLVVCHAGVIRAGVALALSMPADTIYRLDVSLAHFTRLRLGDGGHRSLVFHNRPHAGGDPF